MLQAHETAHQWWGNRVTLGLSRQLADGGAGQLFGAAVPGEDARARAPWRPCWTATATSCWRRARAAKTVESTGPIVLGTRLETSQEPRAWRTITYGKGSWIMHMLRRAHGRRAVLSHAGELPGATTARRSPPRNSAGSRPSSCRPEPTIRSSKIFFDQWVYGTGIPALKLSYRSKARRRPCRLVGTVTQARWMKISAPGAGRKSRLARGRTVTQWVRRVARPQPSRWR